MLPGEAVGGVDVEELVVADAAKRGDEDAREAASSSSPRRSTPDAAPSSPAGRSIPRAVTAAAARLSCSPERACVDSPPPQHRRPDAGSSDLWGEDDSNRGFVGRGREGREDSWREDERDLRGREESRFVGRRCAPDSQGDDMRQAAGDGDQGLVRRVVAAGLDSDGVRAARRRRRLEHRRHGRKTPREDDVAASKVRPGTDDGASSDTSSADAGRRILLPPCLSHGAVSVIGRRRELEDAVAKPLPLSPPTAGPRCGRRGGFAGAHGGSRVAEACRDRMHEGGPGGQLRQGVRG
ncbi:hypothetical protein QYE76_050707 [Lolium multiflorum]|uniref:Uncharacterized protein n=1 Tax=Lolium multiflorum TaxID=4521 RepID=A0AAD8SQH2_LOLMU|nr:hypothetical protein QYE76_050707 [Lolium multiflorum]